MKILVIASPRSGGRYFSESLSKTYGLDFIHEPGRKKFHDLPENVCVKVLPYKPYNFAWLPNLDKVISKFDKVFILDRRDKEDHFKSLWHMWNHTRNMYATYNWDDSKLERNSGIGKNYSVEGINAEIERNSKELFILSVKVGIDIIYYEDLYYDTDKTDLQGLEFKPDLTRKLRKTGNEKLNRLI